MEVCLHEDKLHHRLFYECNRACNNRPSEHKRLSIFSVFAASLVNNYLYYCNKIFNTTAEFKRLSSAAYVNEIVHSKQKILAKI